MSFIGFRAIAAGEPARGRSRGAASSQPPDFLKIGEANGIAAQKASPIGELVEILAHHGGGVPTEHGSGVAKKQFLAYSRSAAEIDLMRRLKPVLDPKRFPNRR